MMAIFSKNKKKLPAKAAETAVVKASGGSATIPLRLADLSRVLLRPRITEKAARGSESHVYVFDVDRDANAHVVREAVKTRFGVSARKVNLVSIPKKSTFVRGRKGSKGGGKKAYVYLKKGESIEIA